MAWLETETQREGEQKYGKMHSRSQGNLDDGIKLPQQVVNADPFSLLP